MPKVQDGPLKNKFQIDHNKLYVIDEEILIMGGFNLFDIGVINRDLMLKIEGPTAKDASTMMRYEWSLGDKFVYKPPKDVYVIKNENPVADALARIVRTDPFESTTKTAIIDAIDNATQSVYLGVLEYSDMDITRALIRANRRGLDVRVMMDRKNTNDKYAGGAPVPDYFPNILPATELFKNRVPVKWYDPKIKGQELHLKMVLIDGNKLITGSTNFTRQAFTTFRETSVVIEGGSAPSKMRRAFMEDWLNSSTSIKKITLKDKIKAKVVDFMDRKYYAWW
jgi:phosphatidylserine/phosphatidylglycerophosphate/cardiolipin synthase-like enzyme